MKTCTKCSLLKSIESFYKDGASVRAECKQCTLAARARYYAGNTEKVIAKNKNAYANGGLERRREAERGQPSMPSSKCLQCEKDKPVSAFLKKSLFVCRTCLGNAYVRNAEKRAADRGRYQATHREQRRVQANTARAADPEKFRVRDKARRPETTIRELAYYKARPEKRAAKNALIRKDYEADPLKYIVRVSNRRAMKMRAPGRCTKEQLRARFAFYGDRCAYCNAIAEAADHVKSLSRGGSNFPANFRPACRACNSSKGSKKLFSEWKPPNAVAV